MKKSLITLFAVLLAVLMVFSGCAGKSGKIVLKMGDCHPDRNSGVGAVLERINAEFIAEYPNVTFEIESLPDQPWQEKARIYAVANQLPDLFKWWTFPNMMLPFVNAGFIEKLNKKDYSGFDYLPGALESCEIDGVLYGIPASGDMWVIYVNKGLFEKAGVPLPSSWEDVLGSVAAFKAAGITPLVTNGLEGWPLCIFFDNLTQRINGDFNRAYSAIDRAGGVKYTDPDFIEAASYFQNLIKGGVFNTNLTTSDYGDAQNQFLQERAAMYMMGSWEMGMAANTNLSRSFLENLDVIKFPVIEGGKGVHNDAMVWFGGNFVVSSKSKNKAMALTYHKFLAERFGSYCWEMGAGFPAQVVNPKEDDTDVSKKLLYFSAEAERISGKAPGLDYGKTNAFKEEFQELIRQLASMLITPEVFAQRLDAAAAQDAVQ